jgi:purine-binding chemotaxis protein CheW
MPGAVQAVKTLGEGVAPCRIGKANLLTTGPASVVIFRLDGARCAIDAAAVVEVLAAVAIRPLPGQPAYVAGALDLRGTIVPVLDLRVRFGGSARPMALSDRLIVARAGERVVALWVDAVDEFAEAATGAWHASGGLIAGDRSLAGVAATDQGLVTIHDVAAFVAQCESDAVFAAVRA